MHSSQSQLKNITDQNKINTESNQEEMKKLTSDSQPFQYNPYKKDKPMSATKILNQNPENSNSRPYESAVQGKTSISA